MGFGGVGLAARRLGALEALASGGCPQVWGRSSAGRAPALQAGGRRFDPDRLHQVLLLPGLGLSCLEQVAELAFVSWDIRDR
jgi:hypothetical protein